MIKQLLLSAAFALCATTGLASVAPVNSNDPEVLTINPDRTLRVQGVVDFRMAFELAVALDKLSAKKNAPIYLVINSPGGSIEAGGIILNAMKTAKHRGSRLKCTVTVAAMSMAFGILSECDDRYAFAYSLLLWHPGKITTMESLSEEALRTYAAEIKVWNDILNAFLIDALDISEEVYYYHYHRETIHSGLSLQAISPDFLTLIVDVKGLAPGEMYGVPE